jgi:SAM-dependent methyltransferase
MYVESDDRLRRQWRDLAAPWIKEAREGRNPTREGLLDAPVLAACGDVTGMRVLDCGCGEGRFCRKLVARGAAYVLGLDACEPMIEAALELASEREEYQVADVENLSFLDDGSFDLAVSYLNQCDLLDFKMNTCEVLRVLKPGGRFIVANLHPMRSAVGGWHRNEAGEKQHVIVDNYFDESERNWRMMGVEFTNYHRTLGTYVNAFVDAGFLVERLVEPSVTKEQLEEYPELDDELRVPNFIMYVLRKGVDGIDRRQEFEC